MAEKIYFMIWG